LLQSSVVDVDIAFNEPLSTAVIVPLRPRARPQHIIACALEHAPTDLGEPFFKDVRGLPAILGSWLFEVSTHDAAGALTARATVALHVGAAAGADASSDRGYVAIRHWWCRSDVDSTPRQMYRDIAAAVLGRFHWLLGWVPSGHQALRVDYPLGLADLRDDASSPLSLTDLKFELQLAMHVSEPLPGVELHLVTLA
jgi:hypothetical protein